MRRRALRDANGWLWFWVKALEQIVVENGYCRVQRRRLRVGQVENETDFAGFPGRRWFFALANLSSCQP